jgi:adenylate cyclase
MSFLRNLIFRLSIQFKLVLIISIIIITSITGIIYIATFFFKKDNEVRIREKNLEITELLGSKTKSDISTLIRVGLEQARGLSEGLISEITPQSALRASTDFSEGDEYLALYLVRIESSKPKIVKKIYNYYGLAGLDLDPKRLDAALSPRLGSVTNASKGKSVIRNMSFDKYALLGIAYPFRGSEGESFFFGVSKVDIIQASFKSSGITDNFMLDAEGNILAHSKKDVVTARTSIKDSVLFRKIQDSPINNGQLTYSEADKQTFIGSFKKIGIGDLIVVTTVPEEKAMEAVNTIQRRNFYLMVVILGFSILVVLIYAKRMITPILRLVDASKRIEKGDFHLTLEEESGDEIGILTKSFLNMSKGLSERDKIKDAFGKFVNSDLAEEVMKGDVKLGGSRKECTIFFSDIRNFTSISEKMQPEDVVEFLNQYMTKMVSCVNKNGGIVDKFIGDSIMAIWGAIHTSDEDPIRAVRTALEMRKALFEFNQERGSQKRPLIQIGIGINTGAVIAGQIGSEERLEFTVIGDAVNLASRIEALNKDFSTDILISESTFLKIRNEFNCIKMKSIQVKGKQKAQTIYAVLGAKSDKSAPKSLSDLRRITGGKTNSKGSSKSGTKINSKIPTKGKKPATKNVQKQKR